MQRLAGRALLEEIGRPGELLRRPARLPGLVYEAAVRVPRLLGETQSWLRGSTNNSRLSKVLNEGVYD